MNQATTLSRYFNELSSIKPLSADAEYDLAVKAKQGDVRSRNKLIEANLRYATSVAKKYVTSSMSIEDIISAANEGLIKAFDRYEPSKGFKFITYARTWIQATIMEELNNRHTVRTPAGKDPMYTSSIDTPIAGTDDLYLYETIAYDGDYADTDLTKNDTKTYLRTMLDTLPQRTKDILDGYFQIYNEYANIDDVGRKYNLTGERMRFIMKTALKELKLNLEN
jgi:RNA polymerase primary sigma factor